MDAVDKRHLKSLVFAIYLVSSTLAGLCISLAITDLTYQDPDDPSKSVSIPVISVSLTYTPPPTASLRRSHSTSSTTVSQMIAGEIMSSRPSPFMMGSVD